MFLVTSGSNCVVPCAQVFSGVPPLMNGERERSSVVRECHFLDWMYGFHWINIALNLVLFSQGYNKLTTPASESSSPTLDLTEPSKVYSDSNSVEGKNCKNSPNKAGDGIILEEHMEEEHNS